MMAWRMVLAGGLTAIALSLGSCDRRGGERIGVRETNADERRRAGMLVLADSSVVQALRAPRAPGRIIYDPPEDLSLANAQRTRPDLMAPDTSRRRDTTSAARRDTTGGDATADTSGGAARRRKP